MEQLKFSYADLRIRYDCDHYKRLALRTKLMQAGILWHARRGLHTDPVAPMWLPVRVRWELEQRRQRHNWYAFKRYEQRVLPCPFVLALREEVRGMIVDLENREFFRLQEAQREYQLPAWVSKSIHWVMAWAAREPWRVWPNR